MKKRKKARIIVLVVIAAIVLVLAGVGVLFAKSLTGLKSLAISPDFTEQELDVNKDYVFTIVADKASASLKSLDYVVDNTSATFAASGTEDGKAVLHTTSEGTVTICVKKSNIESNYLTFSIVDKAAQAAAEAQATAEAEAQAAAEAETPAVTEEAPVADVTELVMATDSVKVRATPSTDGEILTVCKKYDSFTRYEETEDGWSKIDYNGTEAYMKSEYLQVTTEEEIKKAKEEAAKEEEEKKKEEEAAAKKAEETAATTVTPAATVSAATVPAATTPAVTTPAVTTPAAPAPSAAGTIPYTDKNGASTTFTAAEWAYFDSLWSYTGQTEYFIHKHTCAELHAAYDLTH